MVASRGGELLLLESRDQEIERAIEHLDDIARWDLVAEQILRVAELVARALAHAESQAEALGGNRRHSRVRDRGRNWRWRQLA